MRPTTIVSGRSSDLQQAPVTRTNHRSNCDQFASGERKTLAFSASRTCEGDPLLHLLSHKRRKMMINPPVDESTRTWTSDQNQLGMFARKRIMSEHTISKHQRMRTRSMCSGCTRKVFGRTKQITSREGIPSDCLKEPCHCHTFQKARPFNTSNTRRIKTWSLTYPAVVPESKSNNLNECPI